MGGRTLPAEGQRHFAVAFGAVKRSEVRTDGLRQRVRIDLFLKFKCRLQYL